MTLRLRFLTGLLCLGVSSAAEPVIPALAVKDLGEDLKGQILIEELNCVACHAAEGALAAYRQAVPRAELQRDQSARSARLAAQIERARAIARGPVAELDAYRRLVGRQERAQAALKEIDGLPGYDAAQRNSR